LDTHRIEAAGNWIFITADAIIDSEDEIIFKIMCRDITNFISALLKRNGSAWDLVEIDVGTEKNNALYQKWSQIHSIPQDEKRICPEVCPE